MRKLIIGNSAVRYLVCGSRYHVIVGTGMNSSNDLAAR